MMNNKEDAYHEENQALKKLKECPPNIESIEEALKNYYSFSEIAELTEGINALDARGEEKLGQELRFSL